MKYCLECKVDSKIKIQCNVDIIHNEKVYEFYRNNQGFIDKIKITSNVKNPEKFYSEIRPGKAPGVKQEFILRRDNALKLSVILEFQDLESRLAFTGNLKKIYWESPKDEVICETEEERNNVKISAFHVEEKHSDPIKLMTQDDLFEIISTRRKFASLTMPKSFWREGKNDFNSFRYINAFYNFYYIIEGFYSNGKTKNSAIEAEFYNSEEFRSTIKWLIDSLSGAPEHLAKIVSMLKQRGKSLNERDLISLIVKIRGELHHFFNNPNKIQGTPFHHKEFHSISYVLLGLAVHSILKKIVRINQLSSSSILKVAEE